MKTKTGFRTHASSVKLSKLYFSLTKVASGFRLQNGILVYFSCHCFCFLGSQELIQIQPFTALFVAAYTFVLFLT